MTQSEQVRRRFRVGLVVFIALLAFATGIFMVGQRASLFTRKVDYRIHFQSAAGLTPGNAVRLAGVTVGNVTTVELSERPGDSTVSVVVSIERRMTSRIRTDTTAAIKTIGLLGDKYIELQGGSGSAAEIAPGGEIPPANEAGIEKLLAGGEGLLGDLTEIARSLKVILGRTEKGQGLLGQITSDSAEGQAIGTNLNQTLRQLSVTLAKINSGQTLAGKILADERYGRETGAALHAAIASASRVFGRIAGDLENGNGALPALLSDPEGKQKVYGLLDQLSQAGVSLAHVADDLEHGKGLLPVLLHDPAFAADFRRHVGNFTMHLDSISEKLDSGDGSIGKLINDPALYDAANDIVVGVNESKLLRWLIRDRQKRGIEDRYNKAQAAAASTSATSPVPPATTSEPPPPHP
ncbi:MAG TPA: MlaD family protein [Thermoanaerobaculia bacterium]|nr:MlaD family protein [Thermoanaerobaculia bacterium]